MTVHKSIDKICCIVLAFALLVTVLFLNVGKSGTLQASTQMGYETRLFDASYVHTINILMEDWDGFLSSCTDEEYVPCSVVIDQDTYKNVAIRAKGNTSMTQVQNYGNNRYSFKIEFDHYESGKSYYGLDKLSLNNIIQDNSYMKDFLSYQMMGKFGVSAPLCSYAQILVNGEEWGLYLAVESVEEAFLERNYGMDYGELYKPDSINMGGGRGNGGKFNMDDWNEEQGEWSPEQMPGMPGQTGMPDMSGESGQPGMPDQSGQMGQPGMPDMSGESGQSGMPGQTEMPEQMGQPGQTEQGGMLGQFGQPGMPDQSFEPGQSGMPDQSFEPGLGGNAGGMGGDMGSDDVKLVYSDDNYSSYSNIFDNAKTTITDADRNRLIASLKSLNENSDIEQVVDVEAVIRYFVVHNFVCNFDSYTGSMIHNYYLYEKDGQLSMIPWDYNLAFGGFVGGTDATSMVNYPIDSPVSGGTTQSRPMISWIFESEEYTELYHQYFTEFLADYFDSGYFSEMIDSVKGMLSPYVESDPTKFCTYEEFEKGIDTLKDFCLLRAKSVSGQLDGTIPADSEGQTADSSALIDASSLTISDMGSMNDAMGGGVGFPNEGGGREDMQMPDAAMGFPNSGGGQESVQIPEGGGDMTMPDGQERPQGQMPDGNSPGGGNAAAMQPPEMTGTAPAGAEAKAGRLLGVSCAVLFAGLFVAFAYKKRV